MNDVRKGIEAKIEEADEAVEEAAGKLEAAIGYGGYDPEYLGRIVSGRAAKLAAVEYRRGLREALVLVVEIAEKKSEEKGSLKNFKRDLSRAFGLSEDSSEEDEIPLATSTAPDTIRVESSTFAVGDRVRATRVVVDRETYFAGIRDLISGTGPSIEDLPILVKGEILNPSKTPGKSRVIFEFVPGTKEDYILEFGDDYLRYRIYEDDIPLAPSTAPETIRVDSP